MDDLHAVGETRVFGVQARVDQVVELDHVGLFEDVGAEGDEVARQQRLFALFLDVPVE